MAARKPPETSDGPATTHRFTNDTSLIFPNLHHGDIHLVRANPNLNDDGAPVEESGIITLHLGDEVTLPDSYVHTWLEPLNPPEQEDTDGQPAGETITEEQS